LSDYFTLRREAIGRFLAEVARDTAAPPILREPLRVAAAASGKRVRGTLLLAVGESCGAATHRLVPAAAAFEMIHSCSLILDDLPSMDDAEMRRGQQTLHRRFGEDLAILTAVALLNHAYGLLAACHDDLAPRRWTLSRLIGRTVAAVGLDGAIAGQAVDLHSDGAALDFSTLEYVHSRKTGALFVAAAAAGAMLANAEDPAVARAEAYAKNLGLAFQITDDILDVTSDRETLGKDVGKDTGQLTFVKLAGIEGARELTGELIETSLAAIRAMGKKGDRLRELAMMVRERTS